MTRILVIIVCLFFTCCTNKDQDISKVKQIKVASFAKDQTISFDKYFDSSQVIALENTRASLIGEINRISIFNKHIYILDRATNSVFIFDMTGKYISKIHEIGMKEGKYIGIMDFALDGQSKKIIVHSHRPYKLINYTLDGKYISEASLDGFYKNIGIPVTGKLLTINSSGSHIVSIIDIGNMEKDDFLKNDTISEKFKYFSTVFPNILTSNDTYVTFPYNSTVYKYAGNKIVPAYKIDFGKKNMPDSMFNKNLTASEIYNDAMKEGRGFFITNFRETKNYLIFSYGQTSIVIYSKKLGTAESFNFILDNRSMINFENLFGHDGKDDYIISTKLAFDFKTQMSFYKTNPKDWAKIPSYVKRIDSELTENSNPILILYKLK